MKKIYICIGVAGVGKSTYLKDKFVISTDEIRKELFNTLDCQDKHNIIFEEAYNRILNSTEEEIYFDATNLNRKRRANLYRQLKRQNAEVIALCFIKPLKEIIQQNNKRQGLERVPEEVILRMYKTFQVPRISVDCDKIEKAFDNCNFEEEYKNDTEHNSTYHKETVKEHIKMCEDNATGIFKEIAKYHDLGKFICKEFNGQYAKFKNHELVSAMYFLGMNEINDKNLKIMEVIFQHMNAHKGLTDKIIQRNRLTEEELYLIEEFKKIDDRSRVC